MVEVGENATKQLKLTVPARGITITSNSPIEISGADITLTGPTIKLKSDLVQVSGMLKALSVTTGSVIAQSYTNGAGNIW